MMKLVDAASIFFILCSAQLLYVVQGELQAALVESAIDSFMFSEANEMMADTSTAGADADENQRRSMDIRMPSIEMFPEHTPSRNNGARFNCVAKSLADMDFPSGYIIGWEPLLDHPDHVHHIDLFLCKDSVVDVIREPGQHERECNSVMSGKHCHGFAAVYDKGASKFTFPEGVGIRFGRDDTQTSTLVLQIHYLYPLSLPVTRSEEDSSGLRLYLADNNAWLESARMFGSGDTAFRIPPGESNYVHKFRLNEKKLYRMLGLDLHVFRKLSIFAAHLHAHDTCTALTVHHSWEDGDGNEETVLAGIEPYHGYGEDQNFFSLESESRPRQLVAGEHDELVVSCTFDTSAKDETTIYGVREQDEMCGFVMIYYPTDDILPLDEFALVEPLT